MSMCQLKEQLSHQINYINMVSFYKQYWNIATGSGHFWSSSKEIVCMCTHICG